MTPGIFIYLFIYLSRGIQFSRASLNGALTPPFSILKILADPALRKLITI